MRSLSTRLVILCCWAAGLMGLSQSSGLTIYRIGGESIPPPDPDALGAPADSLRFVQLSWEQLNARPFGSSRLVEIRPDSIRPQFVAGDMNLVPTVMDGGGTIKSWETYNGFQFEPGMEVMWDGDFQTFYQSGGTYIGGQAAPYCGDADRVQGYDTYQGRCKYIWLTLPGVFPLRTVRLYPPPGTEEDRYIPTYTLGINDGDPLRIGFREREIWYKQADGVGFLSMDFDVVREVLDNTSGVLEFDFSGEPVQNIIFIAEIGNWWIAEFEVYADGFVVSSNYTSNVIDLEEFAILGPIAWSGVLHPGARVDLRLRSGDTADPNIYFRKTFRGAERSRYNPEGDPLDRTAYLGLEPGAQGGTAPDLDNWSNWSAPLGFVDQAAEFRTSRPRRYVQFRGDFHAGGRLDYLEFPVTRPQAATRAVAEIEPRQAEARESTPFTLFLRPEIRTGDLGFDRIRITTPTPVDSVESVAIDGVSLEFSQWRATVDSTGFEVDLPRIDARRTGEVVTVVFKARIYDYGTVFEGRVSNSTRPWEVPQLLEPGDADFLAESNSLTVELAEVGGRVLEEIEVSTGLFTPNGDRVNDLLHIRFDLVNLSAAVPVSLKVFDLTGRRRAELPLAQRASGPHTVSWDGMDGNSKLLPPGIYVLRLEVETDDATFAASRVVSLAY